MRTSSVLVNLTVFKAKNPREGILAVDRGGVKPLEQDGKPAPEKRSDSALKPSKSILSGLLKTEKPPFGSSSENERSRSQQAYHLATSISWWLSTCQIFLAVTFYML